jgi:hypothetical protein
VDGPQTDSSGDQGADEETACSFGFHGATGR